MKTVWVCRWKTHPQDIVLVGRTLVVITMFGNCEDWLQMVAMKVPFAVGAGGQWEENWELLSSVSGDCTDVVLVAIGPLSVGGNYAICGGSVQLYLKVKIAFAQQMGGEFIWQRADNYRVEAAVLCYINAVVMSI